MSERAACKTHRLFIFTSQRVLLNISADDICVFVSINEIMLSLQILLRHF